MPNRYERECGYSIERLAPKVRDEVIEKYRQTQVEYDWWDFIYQDATVMGALIGIEIDQIQFTGFCSQGDGACFTGRYSHKPGAVKAITAACGSQDLTLIQIAEDLTLLQTTWALEHGFTFEVTIHTTTSRSYHSGVMQTGYDDDDDQYVSRAAVEMDSKIEKLMRRFADWIYRQLEQEYEHLTSDESIMESLESAGLRFSSSGDTI